MGALGNAYQWVQSYVTEDKIYCIHSTESEVAIREDARLGGFPVNSISKVVTVIDPVTAKL
ncbi:nickel-binding protein [Spirosoma telluris]|uniref:nickel-binding protein n=1 Tax=Spirosoma telluris TaxID=2183553 RepID=UPI002FC28B71